MPTITAASECITSAETSRATRPQRRPQSLRLWPLWVLLIVLTGAMLRLWGLNAESLDGDEVFSVLAVSQSLPDLFDTLQRDLVHPPLHYLLLKAALPLTGMQMPWIRASSIIAALATILLVSGFRFAAPRFRTPALVASALLALNTAHIFYSQQVRSYSLFTLLVSMLVLWACCAGRRAEQRSFWFIGWALMTMLVYTHYVGSIYAAAVVVALVLCSGTSFVRRRVLLIAALAAIAFLPWMALEYPVLVAKQGVGQNLAWQGTPAFHELMTVWATFIGLTPVPRGTTAALLVAVALIASALYCGRRAGSSPWPALPETVLLSCTVLPPLTLWILATEPLSIPLFGLRHVLPSIVPCLMLCSIGFCRVFGSSRRTVMVGGLLVLGALQLTPTLLSTGRGPRRVAFEQIAAGVSTLRDENVPAFTTHSYGISGPVNFYLGQPAVRALPADRTTLPDDLAVLYPPEMTKHAEQVNGLVKAGWQVTSMTQYSGGDQSGWPIRLVWLTKSAKLPPRQNVQS